MYIHVLTRLAIVLYASHVQPYSFWRAAPQTPDLKFHYLADSLLAGSIDPPMHVHTDKIVDVQ